MLSKDFVKELFLDARISKWKVDQIHRGLAITNNEIIKAMFLIPQSFVHDKYFHAF